MANKHLNTPADSPIHSPVHSPVHTPVMLVSEHGYMDHNQAVETLWNLKKQTVNEGIHGS